MKSTMCLHLLVELALDAVYFNKIQFNGLPITIINKLQEYNKNVLAWKEMCNVDVLPSAFYSTLMSFKPFNLIDLLKCQMCKKYSITYLCDNKLLCKNCVLNIKYSYLFSITSVIKNKEKYIQNKNTPCKVYFDVILLLFDCTDYTCELSVIEYVTNDENFKDRKIICKNIISFTCLKKTWPLTITFGDLFNKIKNEKYLVITPNFKNDIYSI